jgi:hypothetical protein
MRHSEHDEFDEFWNDDTRDDERWKEPRKAQPAQLGRHAAQPRLARSATVLGLLAGVLGLLAVVSVVAGWLPSNTVTQTPKPAPAGGDRLRGAGAAASGGPSATVAPSRAAQGKAAPKRRPAGSTKRSAGPVPPPMPPRSTALAAAPGPVELSLASYFNNIGIASASNQDAAGSNGGIDGGGFVFSAEALAAAGARAGASITSHGVPFTWPDVAAGAPDNVVAAGQALRVSGAGTTLAFLLTAGWGPAAGSGEVVYASGSTQKFTVDTPDWWTACSKTTPGDALFMNSRYPTDPSQAFTVCVYYASVPLHAGQPVKQIILPNVSAPVPPDDAPSMHIFAVTIH